MALQNTSIRAIVPMVRDADRDLANRINVFNGRRMVSFNLPVARQDDPENTRFWAGGLILVNWRDEQGNRTEQAAYWEQLRNTRELVEGSITAQEAEVRGGILTVDELPEGTTQQDIDNFSQAIILDVHRLQYEDDPASTLPLKTIRGETRRFVNVAGTGTFRRSQHYLNSLASRGNPAAPTVFPEPAPTSWVVRNTDITAFGTLNGAQRSLLDALTPRWNE